MLCDDDDLPPDDDDCDCPAPQMPKNTVRNEILIGAAITLVGAIANAAAPKIVKTASKAIPAIIDWIKRGLSVPPDPPKRRPRRKPAPKRRP